MSVKEQKRFSESLLSLANRSKLSLTGIEKVIATSENKVFVVVSGSMLKISGNKLQVEKLDVENGVLKLNGFVEEIKYEHAKIPFFKRLFK